MTFVVVEGPEGAGKSTLVRWLGTTLRAEGRAVLTVREPGGTPIAEAARKLALKSRHDRAFGAELFLFLAARADLVERVIRPALDSGQVVIADRFGLSTIAYQVAGRGLPRPDVEAALRVATGGLVPDLTLILDIPVTVGRERQRSAGRRKTVSSARMTRFTHGSVAHTVAHQAPGLFILMLANQRRPSRTPPGGKSPRQQERFH